MDENHHPDRKDELLLVLKDTEKEAAEIEQKAQETTETARFLKDVAENFADVIRAIPDTSLIPDQRWKHLIQSWHTSHRIAVEVKAGLGSSERFHASAMATGVTTSTGFSALIDPSRFDTTLTFRSAADRLGAVFRRGQLLADVKAQLKALRLDSRPGALQSPVDLLEDARLALDRPGRNESSALGAWVGLREAIGGTLSELLRRRPTQEPASNYQDKVESLGRQCGRKDLSTEHFSGLGVDLQTLMNTLSEGKDRTVERERLARIFNDGLLFLEAFLGSLDAGRLRF